MTPPQADDPRPARRNPLLDILRLILVLIGACFVVSGVWNQDLSGLLTALGVRFLASAKLTAPAARNERCGSAVSGPRLNRKVDAHHRPSIERDGASAAEPTTPANGKAVAGGR